MAQSEVQFHTAVDGDPENGAKSNKINVGNHLNHRKSNINNEESPSQPSAPNPSTISLILPAMRFPPLIGWPRVGSTWEFRIIAFLNFLLCIPAIIASFLPIENSLFQPHWLCLIHTFLCASLFFLGPGAHPLFIIARLIAIHMPFNPVPGHPKRFSMAIVIFLLASQTIISGVAGPTIPVPLFVLIFALLLDSVCSICLACLIYSDILARFSLLPKVLYDDYKRSYSIHEVMGVYSRWLPQMYKQFARPNFDDESQEDSFVIQCELGVCKMVRAKKDDNPFNHKNDKKLDDIELNMEEMWKQLVTPMENKAPKKKVVDQNSTFIQLNENALLLESGVRNALDDFKTNDDKSHSHGDMSVWTKELFASWHTRFAEDILKNNSAPIADPDAFKLNFVHPYFNKTLYTLQDNLGEKKLLDTYVDEEGSHSNPDSPDGVNKILLPLSSHEYQEKRNLAYLSFMEQYPKWNDDSTKKLRKLRAIEYPNLDSNNVVYLDYTAGNLPGRSQLDALSLLLRENILGNPHSACPASLAAAFLDKHAREAILSFFNTTSDDYDVIFTSNASNACKIVADNFSFTPDSRYLYSFDNHNSIVGIREWAKAKGASVNTVKLTKPELRIDYDDLVKKLQLSEDEKSKGPHLFAYNAQSNVSGVKHPLDYIDLAHKMGWIVLCDVAAFVPSSRLDLTKYRPNFAPISFYKIFGYPTGLGALLVRKDSYHLLNRKGFMGGTVRAVTVHDEGNVWMAEGNAKFEDGTVNYLCIPAVEIGIRYIERVGIDTITTLVECLTGWLINALLSIKHDNGKPLVILYGPRNTHMRGGTIVINLVDKEGRDIHAKVVEQICNRENINVRVGCFCNPGCSTVALSLEDWRVERSQIFGEACLQLPVGPFAMIRISIGLASSFDDVYRMFLFISAFKSEKLVRHSNAVFWSRYAAPGGLC